MIERFLTQTVLIRSVKETGADSEGNIESTVTSKMTNGLLQRRTDERVGRENELGRGATPTEWNLFLPADTSIDQNDVVEIDGESFEVWGEPEVLRSWRGVHHIEARLRRVK